MHTWKAAVGIRRQTFIPSFNRINRALFLHFFIWAFSKYLHFLYPKCWQQMLELFGSLLLYIRSRKSSSCSDKKTFFTEGHSKYMRWGLESVKCPGPSTSLDMSCKMQMVKLIFLDKKREMYLPLLGKKFFQQAEGCRRAHKLQEPCRICLPLSVCAAVIKTQAHSHTPGWGIVHNISSPRAVFHNHFWATLGRD